MSPCVYFCPVMVFSELFLAFGVCCHLAAFAHDVQAEIQEFHEQTKTRGKTTRFSEIVRNIVELHSTTKQLSVPPREYINIFYYCADLIWREFHYFRLVFYQSDSQKYTYLAYFGWAMTTICDILLVGHIEVS